MTKQISKSNFFLLALGLVLLASGLALAEESIILDVGGAGVTVGPLNGQPLAVDDKVVATFADGWGPNGTFDEVVQFRIDGQDVGGPISAASPPEGPYELTLDENMLASLTNGLIQAVVVSVILGNDVHTVTAQAAAAGGGSGIEILDTDDNTLHHNAEVAADGIIRIKLAAGIDASDPGVLLTLRGSTFGPQTASNHSPTSNGHDVFDFYLGGYLDVGSDKNFTAYVLSSPLPDDGTYDQYGNPNINWGAYFVDTGLYTSASKMYTVKIIASAGGGGSGIEILDTDNNTLHHDAEVATGGKIRIKLATGINTSDAGVFLA